MKPFRSPMAKNVSQGKIKFACVEYTTKTRKIWTPQPKCPNYLADPLKEIDPTSFGCYTTALRGEHVPLTGVILGQLEGKRWQFFFRQLHWKLKGNWGSYSLDYFRKFNVVLVVYDWRRGRVMANFAKRMHREFPHLVIIGVPTQPFGQLREKWREPRRLSSLIEFYDSCDVVLSIVRATVPYQKSLTKTPVIYIPQPYPVEYAQQYWEKSDKKEKTIFVAGETMRPDILGGHLAAREIQKRHPDFTIEVTATPHSPLNTYLLQKTKHKVIPFRPWREYLSYLAHVKLVINLDIWWTRGRVQADCAAVGTPSIGGPSDGQEELFPDLLVRDVEDFRTTISLGQRLLEDQAFYNQVSSRARKRLQSYNFAETKERFKKLVAYVREGKAAEYPEFTWENDILVERTS